MKITLEERITSLRTVTILGLSYVLGYAVKLTFVMLGSLVDAVPYFFPRLFSSILLSIVISVALAVGSIHIKNKLIPYFFFCMDMLMLLFLFDAFSKSGIPLFKACFLSLLIASVGFMIISVFVAENSKAKANVKQTVSELKQQVSELKQVLSGLEQKRTEAERFMCNDCGIPFSSQNAKNGHKCSAKKEA